MCKIISLHFISNANSKPLSFFLNVHVSEAYSNTLITHVLIMLILVSVLICLLFHIVLNPTITPVALAILLLISLMQSLSQVSKLPRYTNSVTFSILLPLISIFSSMFSCPNTIVIAFSMLICNPLLTTKTKMINFHSVLALIVG